MIAILDYGIGNLGSIANMLRRCGGDAVVTNRVEEINASTGLILPGVGAFDAGMQKLKASGLLPLVQERVFTQRVPLFGICLGMQLLFRGSEEGGEPGLNWIPGDVKKFDFSELNTAHLKIPHVGWNVIRPESDQPLFERLGAEPRFYFVHSYHAVCDEAKDVAATCNYGYDFACAVRRDNIFAAQFHPEKSHKFGVQLFKNFLGQLC